MARIEPFSPHADHTRGPLVEGGAVMRVNDGRGKMPGTQVRRPSRARDPRNHPTLRCGLLRSPCLCNLKPTSLRSTLVGLRVGSPALKPWRIRWKHSAPSPPVLRPGAGNARRVGAAEIPSPLDSIGCGPSWQDPLGWVVVTKPRAGGLRVGRRATVDCRSVIGAEAGRPWRRSLVDDRIQSALTPVPRSALVPMFVWVVTGWISWDGQSRRREVIDIEVPSSPGYLAGETCWNDAAQMVFEAAPRRAGNEGLACYVSDDA